MITNIFWNEIINKVAVFLAFSTFALSKIGMASDLQIGRNKQLIREHLIIDAYGTGEYLSYAQYIDPKEIQLIFEVGSRDAIDAVCLNRYYKSPVYAFECNPPALERCNYNARNCPGVTIVPYACWDETKTIPFYPVILSNKGTTPLNIGASSCFITFKDGCDRFYEQGDPIAVQAIRLDEWMEKQGISQVDLLCMDVQGATLNVLKGMGKYLQNVKYIITEVYLKPSYDGEALYPEVKEFLERHGFEPAARGSGNEFCDVLFIRTKKL